MELQITKEKVLAAAAKCSTAKAILETLFPEIFKDAEDKYAIRKGLIAYDVNKAISTLSEMLGLGEEAMCLAGYSARSQGEVHRAIALSKDYEWVFVEPNEDDQEKMTLLIPYKR